MFSSSSCSSVKCDFFDVHFSFIPRVGYGMVLYVVFVVVVNESSNNTLQVLYDKLLCWSYKSIKHPID